jgi:hypothetical protein
MPTALQKNFIVKNGLEVTESIKLGTKVVTNLVDSDTVTTISSGSFPTFPNSTVTPAPGTLGNFDLSFDIKQETQQASLTDASSSDAFGITLEEKYSLMDPSGAITTLDLGTIPT